MPVLPDTATPVIVVGGAMGGLRAAEALRKSGYAGPLKVIGAEVHAPYNRPPLSKEVLSSVVTHEAVAFPQRAATEDVAWVRGVSVASADLEAHTLTTEDGVVHPWRALVIATGLRARRLDLPQLPGRHAIRTLDDAIALRETLTEGCRLVVLGSGFLGCEVAATARKLGCEVTVVSPSELPIIRPLGRELAAEIQRRHVAHGVHFRMRTTVTALVGDSRLTGVVLSDGERLDADVLVEAIGSECNDEWLGETGLDVSDGVLADTAMRAISIDGTIHDDVYVVGDIARFPHLGFDDVPRRIEHWNIPTDTGKRVGAVLASWLADDGSFAETVSKPFTPMPTFWSVQFEIDLRAYGLPALADEVRVLQGELSGDCVVGYYRAGRMIGVVGLGMQAALMPYRQEIAAGALQ
ncbi:NAD(P)/FAD-dependent oxidoreductase [Parafrigoribacterium soli]|uniref:NAD(P)/FAD-dependent oxidoreductase n=1 Tax=Parafrigoribacterium soli TaxID=3144663 RepID=UPI0032ECA2C6